MNLLLALGIWKVFEMQYTEFDLWTEAITHFWQIFNFMPPENTRKLLFFGAFRGYKIGTLGQKSVNQNSCCNMNLDTYFFRKKLSGYFFSTTFRLFLAILLELRGLHFFFFFFSSSCTMKFNWTRDIPETSAPMT